MRSEAPADPSTMFYLIRQADSNLLDTKGYTNAAKLIVQGLGDNTRGREIDDALHSLLLVLDHALSGLETARSHIEAMDDITPVDKSNSGEIA
ncbi:hypothetical protein M0654_03535 [Rhizobium sp. NTR19]|uniref:DUF3077 domain-containing protein n=1 Tax=Neorhizobium turbinariae TaxID=2937795 RepID=A0ABT0IMH3_9HYPH|nr:hypothetical protein [Neorhizobium turbinariae]MCK8779051.1 hypothetical protein [Neorhizobium turbinariae]